MKQALFIVHADRPYLDGMPVHQYLEAVLKDETEKRIDQGDPVVFLDTVPGRIPNYLGKFKDKITIVSSHAPDSCYNFISQYHAAKKKVIDIGIGKADVGGLYFSSCPYTMNNWLNGKPDTGIITGFCRHFNLHFGEVMHTAQHRIPSTLSGRLTDILKHAEGDIFRIAEDKGVELTKEDVDVYKTFRAAP